jgi:hypothetical protein
MYVEVPAVSRVWGPLARPPSKPDAGVSNASDGLNPDANIVTPATHDAKEAFSDDADAEYADVESTLRTAQCTLLPLACLTLSPTTGTPRASPVLLPLALAAQPLKG